MVATRHSDEVRAEAKRMYEEDGLPLSQVAVRLGVGEKAVRRWRDCEQWSTAAQRKIAPLVAVPKDIDDLFKTMETLLTQHGKANRSARMAKYDEQLHSIATFIPSIILKMPAAELLSKADKVTSLVNLSRRILGLEDKGKSGGTTISIGMLSANVSPLTAPTQPKLANANVLGHGDDD